MASITTYRTKGKKTAIGSRQILFFGLDGKRQAIRLGTTPMKTAERIRAKIETILACRLAKEPLDVETAKWLGTTVDVKLHRRLVKLGLAEPRQDEIKAQPKSTVTLARFIDEYVVKRTDLKEGTRTNLLQARRLLVKFFGEDRPLESVTIGDANEFRIFLKQVKNGSKASAEGLAEATIRRHLKRAKQIFTAAVEKEIIANNPFRNMKKLSSKGNPKRFYAVSVEETKKVLAACPDAQTRLIFALARYGGPRMPSEMLPLTLRDIHWCDENDDDDFDHIVVHVPKLEHHDGKETRICPIFPELKPYVEEVYDQAGEGTVYLISDPRLRDHSNLRTLFTRIIQKAKIKQWPKLFQNLRSTRQTELAEHFPDHVVCNWIGNSEKVAKEHYLQVTKDHYKRATQNPTQNPTQLEAATSNFPGKDSQDEKTSTGFVEVLPNFATTSRRCELVNKETVTPGGFEPPLRE